MRSIPLHSLVLVAGANTEKKSALVWDKFPHHEILNCEKVAADIYGHHATLDNTAQLLPELYRRANLKLSLGERVVIDAPFLHYKDRIQAVSIGNKYGSPIFYIVTDDGETTKRTELSRGDSVTNVINTAMDDFVPVSKLQYPTILDHLISEGYRGLCVVPDVHGMIESLKQAIDWAKARGLFMVFLGDVLDYGPQSIDCIYLVYDLVMRSQAIMTIGNHERKIERWLDQQHKLVHDPRAFTGKTPMRLSEANKATTMTIANMSQQERGKFEGRFSALLSHARHHWVIGGNLLFTHGACEPEMFELDTPRLQGRLQSRALYGEVDQKTPNRADGYPNRIYGWVDRIPERKTVLVGHDIRSMSKPLCVHGNAGGIAYFCDTGSGKGGRLTTADLIFDNNKVKVQNFTAH